MAEPNPYLGAPRWVKLLGMSALGLLLLGVILVVTGVAGDHGPGRHMAEGDSAAAAHRSPQQR